MLAATSVRLLRKEKPMTPWELELVFRGAVPCSRWDAAVSDRRGWPCGCQRGLIPHARVLAMNFSASPLRTSLADLRLRLKLKCAEQQIHMESMNTRDGKNDKIYIYVYIYAVYFTNTHTHTHAQGLPLILYTYIWGWTGSYQEYRTSWV